MPGDIAKVSVGRQHREVVADTKLRQKRIDRAGLNAAPSTFVFQFGRLHMVAPVGHQQRQRGEPIEDLRSVPRSGEALQNLLRNEAGGYEFFPGFYGADQLAAFVGCGGAITPESQRPDAGLDKQAQRRDRSAL
jgi:hypothetical protein